MVLIELDRWIRDCLLDYLILLVHLLLHCIFWLWNIRNRLFVLCNWFLHLLMEILLIHCLVILVLDQWIGYLWLARLFFLILLLWYYIWPLSSKVSPLFVLYMLSLVIMNLVFLVIVLLIRYLWLDRLFFLILLLWYCLLGLFYIRYRLFLLYKVFHHLYILFCLVFLVLDLLIGYLWLGCFLFLVLLLLSLIWPLSNIGYHLFLLYRYWLRVPLVEYMVLLYMKWLLIWRLLLVLYSYLLEIWHLLCYL